MCVPRGQLCQRHHQKDAVHWSHPDPAGVASPATEDNRYQPLAVSGLTRDTFRQESGTQEDEDGLQLAEDGKASSRVSNVRSVKMHSYLVDACVDS